MKKFLAFTMAAALTLSLAACGSSGGSSGSGSNADNSSSGGSTSGTAFKLGGTGPLTGDASIYGLAAQRGAQIAVEEINASDSSIKFELQSQDDVADGETSVNAYNKLMDWGMQLLVGPTTTGAAQAVSAVTNTDRTFMLTPSASSTDVIDGKDNVFQVCFTDPNQGTGSADYMAENMPDAKIAIIYRNDDAYSQGIHDTFVTEAAAKGLNVVYEGTFTKDTATDFSVQLTGAQSAGATWCSCPSISARLCHLNQANAMGYAPTFFGVDRHGRHFDHGGL